MNISRIAPDIASGVFFLPVKPQMPSMNIANIASEIQDEFDFLDNWEDRYAHIIDLGKANGTLAPSERTENTRVRGCASQVWLVSETTGDGKINIRAESDAMIVSGLIALLIRLYSGQPASDILSFNANKFLEDIGVLGALTAQRSNGLASMLDRIKSDARLVTSTRN